MTNAHKHVTTIFDDSTHALNMSFQIMRVILFHHLIRLNCILYIDPYLIPQLMYVLIYPSFVVLNIIRTIIQALTIFTKPGTYIEQATRSNLLSNGFFYVSSGIEYRRVGFCDEK